MGGDPEPCKERQCGQHTSVQGRHVRFERRVTLLPYVDFTERRDECTSSEGRTLRLLFTVFTVLVVTTKPPHRSP